jgi:hypothetical protein
LTKFLGQCARVTRPLGESSLLEAWEKAQANGAPPVEAARVNVFKSEVVSRLLALCWQLSVASGGGVWYLAGGTAASLVGCSGVTAWNWFNILVQLGVLEIAEPGTTHRATRYVYKPLESGHEKERKLNHAKRHPEKQAR